MANVIFADAGLNAGAKLLRAKSSMHRIRKSRSVFQKFRGSNSNSRLFISIRLVRFSSRRKRFIGRYAAGRRKDGCGGAMNTFPVSLRFLNWVMASLRDTADSPRQSLDCFGEKTSDHRLIFGRMAGFCARSVSSVGLLSFQFGSRLTVAVERRVS